MSVKQCTTEREEERLAAWTLAAKTEPLLRERVQAVREQGSALAALRWLGSAASSSERRSAERSFRRIRQEGFQVLCITDPDFPKLLGEIVDPPLVLTIWGSLLPEDELGVAIVGSRRATPYGLDMSRRLARELSVSGLTIVSGLARGVDGAAHRGALEAGGRTIAVLGSGLRHLYPREHRRLAQRVADRGAVVSEFDLDEPPRGRNFPRRNRIITGLTLGTIVVEATRRSGSLVSARHALDQNREVFAVPGPASSPTSEGVHALIRDGARLVTRGGDVLEELRPDTRERLRSRELASAARSGKDSGLDEDERAILSRLTRALRALDADEILDEVEMPTERALAALCRLEVKGLLWSLPGGLYQVKM